MAWRLRKTIVLVGMMGAGKTAVGTALARILGVPFVDSDDEITRAADRTIPEIFARDGEPFFRRKESQVIARLLGARPGVLSTGGGAFMAEENRRMASERGISVWLDADVDILWNRVRHKAGRPLLRTPDPRQTLADLSQARRPVYALADVRVQSQATTSIEEMALSIITALNERPDVLEKK